MDNFQSLYREDPLRDVENEDYFLGGISVMVMKGMNKYMIYVPSVEEIKGVVFSFPPDKAPRPDKFSSSFYKKF